MFGERLLDFFGISARLVNFINCHNDRHTGHLGVIDGFNRLIHHPVIRCHHQNHNIRNLGTARPHGGKGFVAGCVQENNVAAIDMDMIGAYGLRNPACFAVNNIGLADRVQQRCFPMINMTHDGDNRRAWLEIFRFRLRFQHGIFKFNLRFFHLKTEF